MNKLMESLYDYILDHTLEQYYKETDYYRQHEKRDAVGRKLWEQLPPNQRLLLEEVQRAYDSTADCELEAMFLAAFDEWSALSQRHTAL